ncbi:MAG: DUF3298 domain-containing protein [Romboutsia sp.]|uniref:DUF3298 and DUF4163 domain-containing protein n=1 Tax=Romboutsia sp. TaxID=1965302 RepID=UPI003F369AF8
MLSIDRNIIEENTKLVRCSLIYPVIKEQDSLDNLIPLINKIIHEDIIAFKDVIIQELDNSQLKLNDYVLHAITEYRVSFNKNDIISIPIEFSQLIGLYDITYVNSYNFDLNLSKRLTLDDIFDENTDYVNYINKKLEVKFDYIMSKYLDDYEQLPKEKFKGINHDQNFYIEDDGIVICFSSYEMNKNISYLTEFKLLFSEFKGYLSKYTINNIWLG